METDYTENQITFQSCPVLESLDIVITEELLERRKKELQKPQLRSIDYRPTVIRTKAVKVETKVNNVAYKTEIIRSYRKKV